MCKLQNALACILDTHAAFVSFKTRYGASNVFHQQQSNNPTHWLTEEAPQPNDVFWPFFSSSFMGRWISKLLVVVACILLTILFLIPVVVVQGLTNLSQLEVWFPFLKSILTIFPLFLIPRIFLQKLAVVVPAQASFFIAYVVTSGWTSTSSELFRIIPLICSLMTKCCAESTDDEIEVPSIPYHRDIPRILFFGLLGIAYFFLAPVIMPFLLVYFCLAYIIFRNQEMFGTVNSCMNSVHEILGCEQLGKGPGNFFSEEALSRINLSLYLFQFSRFCLMSTAGNASSPFLNLIRLRYVDIPILLLHTMAKGISILMLSSFYPLSATLSPSARILMIFFAASTSAPRAIPNTDLGYVFSDIDKEGQGKIKMMPLMSLNFFALKLAHHPIRTLGSNARLFSTLQAVTVSTRTAYIILLNDETCNVTVVFATVLTIELNRYVLGFYYPLHHFHMLP
ncbi:hypothetical protein NC653_019852 [Populus alba x Populus x berolinensis]|uniref:Uncharacterized protein n=1 Tax=Populus alba x Populus x berolinensis TaxID=444605 RepID=A0AAD6QBM1_9ROSI|nr:hypothetical protein NC653_019852 [Populus alba x Populus x berolinensis]